MIADIDRRNRQKQRSGIWGRILKWAGIAALSLVVIVWVTPRLIFPLLGYKTFSVPTGGMENTILAGENVMVELHDGAPERGRIIVFKYPGHRDQVEAEESAYYLKRCVATAGDTLEVRNTEIYINGVKQAPPPNVKFDRVRAAVGDMEIGIFPRGSGYTRDNWGPMRIPKKGDVIPLDDSNFERWEIFIGREGHQARNFGGGITIDGAAVTSYTVERDYCFGMGDNRFNSEDSRYWGFIPNRSVIGTPRMIYWSRASEENHDGWADTAERQASGIRWERIFTSIE